MNLFTVITVTYNAEDTLLRTLKSVQEQTYSNIEHIIVDGNSTDGTVELIKKYHSLGFEVEVAPPPEGYKDYNQWLVKSRLKNPMVVQSPTEKYI